MTLVSDESKFLALQELSFLKTNSSLGDNTSIVVL